MHPTNKRSMQLLLYYSEGLLAMNQILALFNRHSLCVERRDEERCALIGERNDFELTLVEDTHIEQVGLQQS